MGFLEYYLRCWILFKDEKSRNPQDEESQGGLHSFNMFLNPKLRQAGHGRQNLCEKRCKSISTIRYFKKLLEEAYKFGLGLTAAEEKEWNDFRNTLAHGFVSHLNGVWMVTKLDRNIIEDEWEVGSLRFNATVDRMTLKKGPRFNTG